MAEVRGMRKTRIGVVVSDKMDKTIVVAVPARSRPTTKRTSAASATP